MKRRTDLETKDYRGERLLDVNNAAEMLGLKASTLYQWAYERRLPVVKLGRALRFRLSDIQTLIAQSVRPALSSWNDERVS
jgi:excisionase family DNA binding protein